MNQADCHYQSLIEQVLDYGDLIETRNHAAYSLITSDLITFTQTPLVTVRKTAWKKALREMEWFLSGDQKCPDELLDWWDGQLNQFGKYLRGYGDQLIHWQSLGSFDTGFNQIKQLITGINEHPYSRRHIITTWNPLDMSLITEFNENPKTPTTCHNTLTQAFVRHGELSLRTYQRSADILLGVPHNFCQTCALLLWLCNQTGLQPGLLMWQFGDLHLYDEPSHIEVADAIIGCDLANRTPVKMVYNGTGDFKASDFEIVGEIAEPVTTIRPKLL